MDLMLHSSHKGFTLIEMLVVIAIISILLGIGINSFTQAQEKAKQTRAKADLRQIRNGVVALQLDTGKYPNGCPPDGQSNPEVRLDGATSGLVEEPTEGTVGGLCEWTASDVSRWAGPYVPKIPKDPWGESYWFDPDYWGVPGAGGSGLGCAGFSNGVAMVSLGKDKAWYTCDDIAEMLFVNP